MTPARPASVRRVLVCPQEFKGSLDAVEAAAALARGVRAVLPDAEVIERPLADGGPGTAAIIAAAAGGEMRRAIVRGAYGDPVEASYALLPDGLAVVESAQAVGLALTPPEGRAPLVSSSAGVGELLLAAVSMGARRIVVGVGGTATSDGGAGVARALGLRLLDRNGHDLPPGGIHLARLARVQRVGVGDDAAAAALREIDVRVAVDVRNPLTGSQGAVATYGRQKGLADWQAPALDAAVRRWAARVREDLGREIEDVAGAGAGGGIPAGILAALPHAHIEAGAALVGDAIGLRDLVASVDLVVTGEGALDAQTTYGKTVGYVAEVARDAGRPCLAVAGLVEGLPAGVADAEALVAAGGDVAASMADAGARAADAARRVVERWARVGGA